MAKENLDTHKATVKVVRPQKGRGVWLKVTFLSRDDKIHFSNTFREKRGSYGYTISPLPPQALIKYERDKLAEARSEIKAHFESLGHRLNDSDLIVLTSTRMNPEFRFCWKVIIRSTGFRATYDTNYDIKTQINPGPPPSKHPSGLKSPRRQANRISSYNLNKTSALTSAMDTLRNSKSQNQLIKKAIEDARSGTIIDDQINTSEGEHLDTEDVQILDNPQEEQFSTPRNKTPGSSPPSSPPKPPSPNKLSNNKTPLKTPVSTHPIKVLTPPNQGEREKTPKTQRTTGRSSRKNQAPTNNDVNDSLLNSQAIKPLDIPTVTLNSQSVSELPKDQNKETIPKSSRSRSGIPNPNSKSTKPPVINTPRKDPHDETVEVLKNSIGAFINKNNITNIDKLKQLHEDNDGHLKTLISQFEGLKETPIIFTKPDLKQRSLEKHEKLVKSFVDFIQAL